MLLSQKIKFTSLTLIFKYAYYRVMYKLARDPLDLIKIEECRNLYAFKLANKNKNTYFVIGDSHTDVFSKNRFDGKTDIGVNRFHWFLKANYSCGPEFITYHIDAVTAYSSFSDNSATRCKEKINYLIKNGFLPKRSRIILSFGEIDCRVHILRQAELRNITTNQVITEIINNYAKLINFLKSKEFSIIVYGPVGSQSDQIGYDPLYPRYGDERTRNRISKEFTDCLSKYCTRNNIQFLTVFDELVNGDYKTDYKFYRDGVHLNGEGRKLIIKKLSQMSS